MPNFRTAKYMADGTAIDDPNDLQILLPAQITATNQLLRAAARFPVSGQFTFRVTARQEAQSNGAVTCGNYKLGFFVKRPATSVVFTYANRIIGATGTSPESTPPNSITVRAAIELNGYFYPILFGGKRDILIEAGGVVESDPVPCVVVANDIMYLRTNVSVATLGMVWGTAGGSYIAANASSIPNDGAVTSTTYSDLTTSGTITGTGVATYGPTNIVAKAAGLVAVASLGDSIVFGQVTTIHQYQGTFYGYEGRLLDALGMPHTNLALSGEQAANYALPGNRQTRSFVCRGLTHATVSYGINDILATGNTLAQIQADLQKIWNLEAASGRLVAQKTLLPCTNSTDSWTTVANQTDKGARVTSIWYDLNTWIRTKPFPLSAVLPVGDAMMASPLANKWVIGGMTADGTHPSEASHAAIAADANVIAAYTAFLQM